MSAPVRLTPSLREKIWGKTRLSPWFADSREPIGEVWFLAERDLPILVKLLFTTDRLSVQVHPDDGEGGPRGKTEMWHILEAEPGATIALGFRRPITREQLLESTRTGEIESLLNWMPVRPGQTFFTPAHTVHAIGAGIVLCEIQQNSDVTYRLWDYGRPRPLHIEQALPISDLSVHPGAIDHSEGELVRSPHFATDLIHLAPGRDCAADPHDCHLWICLAGEGSIDGSAYKQGEVWHVADRAAIAARSDSRFLRTYVPPSNTKSPINGK